MYVHNTFQLSYPLPQGRQSRKKSTPPANAIQVNETRRAVILVPTPRHYVQADINTVYIQARILHLNDCMSLSATAVTRQTPMLCTCSQKIVDGPSTRPALNGGKKHFSSLAILQRAVQDLAASKLADILILKLD